MKFKNTYDPTRISDRGQAEARLTGLRQPVTQQPPQTEGGWLGPWEGGTGGERHPMSPVPCCSDAEGSRCRGAQRRCRLPPREPKPSEQRAGSSQIWGLAPFLPPTGASVSHPVSGFIRRGQGDTCTSLRTRPSCS